MRRRLKGNGRRTGETLRSAAQNGSAQDEITARLRLHCRTWR